eukprot:2282645-Rhodomonas_salina.2
MKKVEKPTSSGKNQAGSLFSRHSRKAECWKVKGSGRRSGTQCATLSSLKPGSGTPCIEADLEITETQLSIFR